MRIRHDIIRQQVIDRDKKIEDLKKDIEILKHSFKFTETFLNGRIANLELELSSRPKNEPCNECKRLKDVIAGMVLDSIVEKKKWWQFWKTD